jgi:hypothetical protein
VYPHPAAPPPSVGRAGETTSCRGGCEASRHTATRLGTHTPTQAGEAFFVFVVYSAKLSGSFRVVDWGGGSAEEGEKYISNDGGVRARAGARVPRGVRVQHAEGALPEVRAPTKCPPPPCRTNIDAYTHRVRTAKKCADSAMMPHLTHPHIYFLISVVPSSAQGWGGRCARCTGRVGRCGICWGWC